VVVQAKDIYTQRPQNAEFVGARSAALAEQYSVNPKTIRDIWLVFGEETALSLAIPLSLPLSP
jgi:hypothetical protein